MQLGSCTTSRRGRCAGNGLRSDFARLRRADVGDGVGGLRRRRLAGAAASSSSSLSSSCSIVARSSPTSGRTLSPQPRDLQLELLDLQRLRHAVRRRPQAPARRASAWQRAAQRRDVGRQRRRRAHGESYQQPAPAEPPQLSPAESKCRAYPATCGRHVRTGMRQSIPSSNIASCAGVSATVPSAGERPDEAALLQPLGVKAQALAVPPQHLDQRSPSQTPFSIPIAICRREYPWHPLHGQRVRVYQRTGRAGVRSSTLKFGPACRARSRHGCATPRCARRSPLGPPRSRSTR